jgi:hypothetical protein
MNRPKDPVLMSSRERLAEMGSLLARGYRRSQLSASNPLEDCAPVKRACGSTANSPEHDETQEVA